MCFHDENIYFVLFNDVVSTATVIRGDFKQNRDMLKVR